MSARRAGRAFVALVGVIAMLFGGVASAGIANAAGSSQFLRISKTVDGNPSETLTVGKSFTYQINLDCSEQNCVNATMTDALPVQLQGFSITNVQITPSTVGGVATWSEAGQAIAQPSTVGSATALSVALNQGFPGGKGLAVGTTAHVNVTLQVPSNFSPMDPRNGKTITNTATSTASNSADDASSADVVVKVDQNIDAAITKSWSPATDTFSPGKTSTITLQSTNTSNVAVDKLVVQDPQASGAAEGAATLDANNPFRTNDFQGFGTTAMPTGATAVQVDAYVYSGGAWRWVTGTATSAYALPAGVTAAQVGGLRFTYTGAIGVNASDNVQLKLAQRASDRNDNSDLSTVTSTISNVAQAQTTKGATSSTVKTSTAPYKVSPANIATSVSKSFADSRIPAGNTTTATITAKNTQSPVKTLTLGDNSNFFTATTTFGGFTAAINYPQSATSGKVVYHLLAGGDQTVSFASGTIPAAPSANISGFDIVFDSNGNDIVTNGQSTATFTVKTSSGVDFGTTSQLTSTNTATSTVKAQNGQTATTSKGADLTQVKPAVKVDLQKTVTPSNNVQPGQGVIASLASTTSSMSDYVKPTKIVVQDSWADATDRGTGFWNAFDVTSIQPTQVPANAKMTVEVQRADGSWAAIDSVTTQQQSVLYQLSANDLQTKLFAAGLTPGSVTGIRFTFDATTSAPFPYNTTVNPYVGFTARGQKRDASGPTDTTDPTANNAPQSATTYTNTAVTTGTGTTNDGKQVEGNAKSSAPVGVIVYPGTQIGVHIAKTWDKLSVDSQSGETANTALNWRVLNGMKTVTLTDAVGGDENTPKNTVFDAFNLTQISPIGASGTPYTNGWYLKYDTISAIELYYNNQWHTVAAPAGAWQNGDGSFKGYTLNATEQASTTGVRITVAPNDTARTNALSKGTDPYAPAAGSGVVSSTGDRMFNLAWQLRNKTRSNGSFVTKNSMLNTATAGLVNNTVGLDGTPYTGADQQSAAGATIQIINQMPLVHISKTVAKSSVIVPSSKDGVPAGQYPTNTYTLVANNGATARASYVRIIDPLPCADTNIANCLTNPTAADAVSNPFATMNSTTGDIDSAGIPNPFNRQNITGVTIAASVTNEVDLAKSVVWLLEYDPAAAGNRFSAVQTTASAVNAMTAAQLANVVGLSATFQGTDPGSVGGSISQGNRLSIAINTTVRATLRSTGAAQDLSGEVASNNRASAQSYDPISAPTSPTGQAGDMGSAAVRLSGGTIDVNPGKTITDGNIAEPKRGELQTVTLNADQGTSTVSPTKVVIEDSADGNGGSTNFWTNFQFVNLTGITFPAGADRVQIDTYDGTMWTTGSPQPVGGTYTLPVSQASYANIRGLRFTFTRADGALFSLSGPNWNAHATYSVQMRPEAVFPVQGSTSTAIDQMTAQSFGNLDQSAKKAASAPVTWSLGTASLAIDKLANDGTRSANIGDMVPWNITLKNSGTGYLDLTKVTDTLPAALKYTGSGSPADPSHPVIFTAGKLADGSAGTLVTTPAVDSSDPTKVVFTWPNGQNRLQPGESAIIRIWLELQPGPQSGDKITNNVSVQTAQRLDNTSDAIPNNGSGAVTPINANGNTPASGDPTTGAQTSDYVSPTAGENLYVVKGVSGSLSGAVNTLDPMQNCTATLQAASGSQRYYHSPCAANSTINGTDSWLLKAVNAGTTTIKRAQFFDQLPVQGDKYLVDGTASRGSAFRPQLTAAPQIVGAPSGTTVKIEATSDSGACVGTWSTIPAAADACGTNHWVDQSAVSDWSKITGIRVTLDFTTSTLKALAPGQEVDVTYSSKNVPASSADSSGASVNTAAGDQYAWNQFGLLYTGASGPRTIAPNIVGVQLRTGSVEVAKQLAGNAKAYAPNTFTATLSCATGDGTAITFGSGSAVSKQVTLTKQADGTYAPVRISGIPLSIDAKPTTCTVAEDGNTGKFGETARSISPNTALQVTTADTLDGNGAPTNAVPAAQIATITNTYDYAGLTVTKRVSTPATAGSVGPFTFSLACTTSDGQPVKFGSANSTSFTIAKDATWTAPANTIPAGSTCTLSETDSKGADSTVYTGDGITGNANGTATLKLTAGSSQVIAATVTNHFDAGTFTVTKKVDGAGAAIYGSGPFTFNAVCAYTQPGGSSGSGTAQQLLNATFQLAPNGTKTFGVFPAGTQCQVKETDAKGATSSSMNPVDGSVTIARQTTATAVSNVTVTATNTYDIGTLTIIKKRTGPGASANGKGPFEAQVSCSYQSGADTRNAPLPDNGRVVLAAANGYRATVGGILIGAKCRVVETQKGGADSSSTNPGNGTLAIAADGAKNIVTITNVFGAPPASGHGQALGATGSSVAVIAFIAMVAMGLALVLMVLRRNTDSHETGRHINTTR